MRKGLAFMRLLFLGGFFLLFSGCEMVGGPRQPQAMLTR